MQRSRIISEPAELPERSQKLKAEPATSRPPPDYNGTGTIQIIAHPRINTSSVKIKNMNSSSASNSFARPPVGRFFTMACMATGLVLSAATTAIPQESVAPGFVSGEPAVEQAANQRPALTGDRPLTNASAQSKKAKGQKPTRYWPKGVPFDTAIPTPEQFFGFDIGFRHLSHDQVAAYVRLLAETSDRISIQQYAETHGGRPLLLMTITSLKNRARLKDIRQAHRRLTKSPADQVNLNGLPAVINMGYGVHGDEPSATNCAPLVAYYLAAAQGDEIQKVLENCVILLDPSINPDGFNRFANWANRYRGRSLNPDPAHAEHNQMWPPGRVNYYWFDLNRDWLPLVHPESRGRMNWYHAWKPNVVLDFHEMGTNSTFFFQPGIPERTNPLTPVRNQELTRQFASYHSKELDQRGSLYFTQERFDDFYMGKGSTYPDLHGSVGILFEQASSRGHMQENQDGILRFHDTIANQFTASLTSLRATSEMRTELLNFKKYFYERAAELADTHETKTYIFRCPHNRSRLLDFARVLKQHDIDSFLPQTDIVYGDKTFSAADSLVVPARQAEFRFLQSLLMRQTDFRENIFYDVSSWTLPLAYGMEQVDLKRELDVSQMRPFRRQPANASAKQRSSALPTDTVAKPIAYFVDCRDDAAPWLLSRLQNAGVKVRVATEAMTITTDETTTEFPAGSLSIVLGIQPQKRAAITRILTAGKQRGAVIEAVTSGLATTGPDLGTPTSPVLKKPSVAMLIGGRVSPYSAGAAWHLLDTQVNMPVTLLQDTRFARTDLDRYNTLILADGRLANDQWDKIQTFAREGGTVIACGSIATSVQAKLRESNQTAVARASESNEATKLPLQKPFASASDERALQLISGAIFNTKVDLTHPLLYGFTQPTLPVFRSHGNFLQPSSNPYRNPLIYDSEQPLLAGYCSTENVEKFKGSASVVVEPSGRGRFILMADEPNFRGFWKGTSRLFLNAVFFGELID